MSLIPLSSGFTVTPEGHYTFHITKVEYKEAFGKLTITMSDGKVTHTERYSLLKTNGQLNDGAVSAFSFFARSVMDDMTLEEIDPDILVGKYLECDIEHDVQESTKNPGQSVIYTRMTNVTAAAGAAPSAAQDDLASLLSALQG